MKESLIKAIEFYKNGLTITKAAKNANVSVAGLRYNIKKLNLKRSYSETSIMKYKKESLNKAIELRKAGHGIKEIWKITKISTHTLRNILKDIKKGKLIKLENPLFLQAVELYKQGLSTIKVAEITKLNPGTLASKFKKLGIIRSNKINSRKYKIDHNFFENIDTEHKAYWLGFIYADGYISSNNKNYKRVGIALGIKDKEHLKKFVNITNSNYPINHYTNKSFGVETEYCRLLISSDKMFNDLLNKGVFLNKTLILKFPNKEQVPKELLHHFLRGYFDGDGSFAKNKKEYTIKVCGTKEFLEEFLNFIDKPNIKLLRRHKKRNNNNFQFSIGGRLNFIRITDILYKDATVFLERKYERYIEFKNKYKHQNREEYKIFLSEQNSKKN